MVEKHARLGWANWTNKAGKLKVAYKAGKLRKLRKLNTGAGLRGALSKGAIQFAQFAQKIGAGYR